MVEDVEELRVKTQLEVIAHGEPLRDVEVAPYEIRATQSVAGNISELTILRIVAAIAGSRAWIR